MPTTTTAIRLVTAQSGMCAVEHHVHDQGDDCDEIEDPVREDGAEQARPGAGLSHPPVQHRDARELADPPGQDRVREQADGESREDEHEPRVAAVRTPARSPSRHANERATTESRFSPTAAATHCPLDRREGIGDAAPVRPAPPEQQRPTPTAPSIRRRACDPARCVTDRHACRLRLARRSPRAAGDVVPRVALDRELARAASPSAARRGSSSSRSTTASASARSSPGGTRPRSPPS